MALKACASSDRFVTGVNWTRPGPPKRFIIEEPVVFLFFAGSSLNKPLLGRGDLR
jgi:hypothetical protein